MTPELFPLRDEAAARLVAQAAREDNHFQIGTTHGVAMGGEIVGAVSLGAVPLLQVWTHTEKMAATHTLALMRQVEAVMRDRKAGKIAVAVPTSSPLYPFATKMGAVACPNVALFTKDIQPALTHGRPV